MESAQEVVGEIRRILREPGEASLQDERIREVAAAYSRFCLAVNERAYQCLELLRQGKQKEAAEAARKQPDLLEEACVLDFEQADRWFDFCNQLGVDTRDRIDTETISSIVADLYEQDGNLERLLRVHRLLSLGQAPMDARLKLLRRIRWLDPHRTYWREDIQACEQAYREEMLASAVRARREMNLETLEEILNELRTGQWQEPVPAAFIEKIEKLASPVRRNYAREQFERLSDQLQEAYSNMDEGRCESLLEQYRTVVDRTGVEAGEELAGQIAAVRQWLADVKAERQRQAAYEKACDSLQQALDESRDEGELERLAAAVLSFERGMPEVLAARFSSRIQELQRSGKRKFTLTLVAVISAVLLIGAGAAVSLLWYSRTHSLRRWEEQIRAALAEDNLETTGKLLADLADMNPKVSNSPKIKALRVEYERKASAEEKRKRDFEQFMAEVETAPMEKLPALLNKARSLARTFDEKNRVEDWRQKTEQYKQEQQAKRDSAFEAKIEQLEALYGEVQDAANSGPTAVDAAVAKCVAFAEKLNSESGVSGVLKNRVWTIRDAAIKIRKSVKEKAAEEQRIRRDLASLSSKAGNLEELADSLRSFCESHPEHPFAIEFQTTLRMEPYWLAMTAWNKLVAHWNPHMQVESSDEAEKRLHQVDEYLDRYPPGPHKAAAMKYRRYLQLARAALQGGHLKGLKEARETLARPLISDLYILRTKTKKNFYLRERVFHKTSRRGVHSFEYIIDGALNTRIGEVSSSDLIYGTRPAPQVAFSKEAAKLFENPESDTWETFHVRLAAIAYKHDRMDPILRANLVRFFLKNAADTTPFETDKIRQFIESIDQVDIDVAWMDPFNEDANAIRGRVARILKSLPPLQSLEDLVNKDMGNLREALVAYRPVAVLLSRAPYLRLGEKLNAAPAFVLAADSKSNARLKQIGTINGGKLVVDAGAIEDVSLGTPIFVVQRGGKPVQ